MNQSSFFKDAGTFFIAFIVGTVSLHGMLFYLVTDATSFFSGNNLAPLLIFLVLYAAIPFVLFVFRRKIFGDRLLHNYRIKNNLTTDNAINDIDKERKKILKVSSNRVSWNSKGVELRLM